VHRQSMCVMPVTCAPDRLSSFFLNGSLPTPPPIACPQYPAQSLRSPSLSHALAFPFVFSFSLLSRVICTSHPVSPHRIRVWCYRACELTRYLCLHRALSRSSKSGYGCIDHSNASAMTDGNASTLWVSPTGHMPVAIELDLGGRKEVQSIVVSFGPVFPAAVVIERVSEPTGSMPGSGEQSHSPTHSTHTHTHTHIHTDSSAVRRSCIRPVPVGDVTFTQIATTTALQRRHLATVAVLFSRLRG
jgi:hypothetical protein